MRTIRTILDLGPDKRPTALDPKEEKKREKRLSAPNRTFPPKYASEKNRGFQRMCRNGDFR